MITLYLKNGLKKKGCPTYDKDYLIFVPFVSFSSYCDKSPEGLIEVAFSKKDASSLLSLLYGQ